MLILFVNIDSITIQSKAKANITKECFLHLKIFNQIFTTLYKFLRTLSSYRASKIFQEFLSVNGTNLCTNIILLSTLLTFLQIQGSLLMLVRENQARNNKIRIKLLDFSLLSLCFLNKQHGIILTTFRKS